jgi:hypothetical protein
MSGNEIKPNQEQRRPIGIKVLSVLLFLISLFYLLKLSQVLLHWSRLEKLPLTISPLYLAVDSLVWCVSAIILAWGLWVGRSWARPTTLIISILFSLVFWADRIWIAEPEGLAQRWPINIILTIIGLGMILLVLNRKSTRDYFWENPAKIP